MPKPSYVTRLLDAIDRGRHRTSRQASCFTDLADRNRFRRAITFIDQDPLGLDRIYVRAKRYSDGNTVGAGAIRDFFGSLDRFKASKGLFVTTSTFSPSARETADLLSKRIVLIDGGQMARLMIRHGIGCRVEEALHIKKVDEEFFD